MAHIVKSQVSCLSSYVHLQMAVLSLCLIEYGAISRPVKGEGPSRSYISFASVSFHCYTNTPHSFRGCFDAVAKTSVSLDLCSPRPSEIREEKPEPVSFLQVYLAIFKDLLPKWYGITGDNQTNSIYSRLYKSFAPAVLETQLKRGAKRRGPLVDDR